MIFSQSEIAELISQDIEIECYEIRLTQRTDKDPLIYRGSGTIYFNADGRLTTKLNDPMQKSNLALLKRTFLTAGIVSEADHFDFEATDGAGNTWICERIFIYNGIHATPYGTTVTAELPLIKSSKITKPVQRSYVEIALHGTLNLPYNLYIENQRQGKDLTGLEFEIHQSKFQITQHKDHLLIRIDSKDLCVDQNYICNVLDGMALACGKELPLVYYTKSATSTYEKHIHGFGRRSPEPQLEPIVPLTYFRPEQLSRFIEAFVNNRTRQHDHMMFYWRRLASTTQLDEVAALVLTVNIEGMIKNYFSNLYTPAEKLINEIRLTKNRLRKVKFPSSTKSRIGNALGGMQKLSPQAILREMEKEGIVSKLHVDSWLSLRNLVAHADNLKSDEVSVTNFYNNLYLCMDLFYVLICREIGYTDTRSDALWLPSPARQSGIEPGQ
jgi:hypothetical protein